MEVLLEKSSPTTASLKVTLVKEDYQPKVDKSIKEYSKRANIKGFRPGKVPAQVISRMYGKGILIDEVNHLLSHAVSDYIRDNKLQVVGDPLPNTQKAENIDWDRQTSFEFEYDLGLAGDFVVDFEKVAGVPKYTINADEAELEKTIEDLRNRFADNVHPEVSEDGDILYGELAQESSGFSTKTAIPTKKLNEGSKASFTGVKKGDVIAFDIQQTFEDEAAIAHVTGKKKTEVSELAGEFRFTVEDITRTASAELNQEFFEKVLGKAEGVETEEQFREKVMSIIRDNYAREADALLRRDTEESLLNSVEIDLPEEFLKNWLERTNEGKFTREQIEEEFDTFAKSLRLSLIRNRIAESHELKVEPSELMDYTREMVRSQFGLYGDEEAMRESIDKIAQGYLMDKERDNYSKIFQQVFDQKVYDVIRGAVPNEEKTIEVSEFEKLARGEQ